MGKLRYLADVVTLALDADVCIGCRMCERVCPHGVFKVEDTKAHIVDRDACMECGACATNCPVEAISVEAGVGCAAGVIQGAIRGTEPTCDCAEESGCCG